MIVIGGIVIVVDVPSYSAMPIKALVWEPPGKHINQLREKMRKRKVYKAF